MRDLKRASGATEKGAQTNPALGGEPTETKNLFTRAEFRSTIPPFQTFQRKSEEK
jgi:hypothetical protein